MPTYEYLTMQPEAVQKQFIDRTNFNDGYIVKETKSGIKYFIKTK